MRRLSLLVLAVALAVVSVSLPAGAGRVAAAQVGVCTSAKNQISEWMDPQLVEKNGQNWNDPNHWFYKPTNAMTIYVVTVDYATFQPCGASGWIGPRNPQSGVTYKTTRLSNGTLQVVGTTWFSTTSNVYTVRLETDVATYGAVTFKNSITASTSGAPDLSATCRWWFAGTSGSGYTCQQSASKYAGGI